MMCVGTGDAFRNKFLDADLHGRDPAHRRRVLRDPALLRGHVAPAQAPGVRVALAHLLALRGEHHRRQHHSSLRRL